MKPLRTLLGIDIGTSGLKASLFDESGGLLAQAYRPSTYLRLPDGQMEQQPEQWWKNLCSAMGEIFKNPEVSPASIAGIGLCGFHHCPVFVKENGEPAREVIILHDNRLSESRRDLEWSGALQDIENLTRSMVSAGHFPPIFHYVATREPEWLKNTRWILLAKDYLRFRLTGRIATEICDATGTNLIEPGQNVWSDRLCRILSVPASLLPPIGMSSDIAGSVTDAAAEQTGLVIGTPVVYGGGDSHCALLGLGCIKDGDTGLMLGTNSTLRTVFTKFVSHPRIKLWVQHHVVPDQYSVSASSMAGASVLNWFREQFLSSCSLGELQCLEREAENIPIGSGGLIFLPYIYGERCPFYDPDASGALLGIRHNHKKEHLFRGVLEGVTINMRRCFDLISECAEVNNTQVGHLRLGGGGSRISFWRQIISDCMELPIHVMSAQEAGTLGAALLAGIGAGVYADHHQAVAAAVSVNSVIEPHSNNIAGYRKLRKKFNVLLERNK